MSETTDHRERRLMQLCEALQPHLDEGQYFALIIATPGDLESINLVSNIPVPEEFIEVLAEIVNRHAKGRKPQEL
jgi:hypothetical protein